MVSIRAHDLGLTYPLRRRLALERFDRRMKAVPRRPHRRGRLTLPDGNRSVEALRGVDFALEAGEDRKSVV